MTRIKVKITLSNGSFFYKLFSSTCSSLCSNSKCLKQMLFVYLLGLGDQDLRPKDFLLSFVDLSKVETDALLKVNIIFH